MPYMPGAAWMWPKGNHKNNKISNYSQERQTSGTNGDGFFSVNLYKLTTFQIPLSIMG
jgi:hypothetical protein